MDTATETKDAKASETPPIAPETETIATPLNPAGLGVDAEAKIAELEKEKNRVIEEAANYKMAYLKEKKKNERDEAELEESEDDRMRRIANETLANSRLAEIAREQDAIIKQALKENKELKLAQMNKISGTPTAVGSHTETKTVPDTLVTEEQLAAFRARGWDDKKIERYKKNLIKNMR